MLAKARPDLVVVSEGSNFPPLELVEFLASSHPFVTISHNNTEHWWPEDPIAARLRKALSAARRCYFVSEKNRELAKKQIGSELANSSIVRNPFNAEFDACVGWPTSVADQGLVLACVGRLDPRAKGQDILIEALATPRWMSRRWRLELYGKGPMKEGLEQLVSRSGLTDRVFFAGEVRSVRDIWEKSHILVQPSRHEGLPLTIVEAMLYGRPVIATDVAGNAEVILDGVTGFLAEAPTVASMAEALERAWIQQDELRQMGQRGAERIRSIMPRNPAKVFATELAALL
jgi:glycosyltransferase involved in cell wall biosynthesis